MKTIKSLATLTLCVLSVFGSNFVLNTQQAKAQKTCSNSSLYGTFAVQGQGYENNTDLSVITGTSTFDGNGKFTALIRARSLAGKVSIRVPVQGTYEVTSDCTLTRNLTRADGTTGSYTGVVYDNGKKFIETQTNPGSALNIRAEKANNDDR